MRRFLPCLFLLAGCVDPPPVPKKQPPENTPKQTPVRRGAPDMRKTNITLPGPEPTTVLHRVTCRDESGEIVMQTEDVGEKPTVEGTTWSWRDREMKKYTMVSVPPHKCVYEAKLMTFSEAPEAPPTWGED